MKRLGLPILAAALAAVLATGCKNSTARPGAHFNQPTGLAGFRGYSTDHPGELREYVAVANTRGDELRLVDALTDRVVLAPALIQTLSVPVLPRPVLLAAGPLHDQDAGAAVALPDLLVVASDGLVPRDQVLFPGQASARLQVMSTWKDAMDVALTVDLGDLAPAAEILTMVTGPVPVSDGSGGFTAQPGAVRLYVGLTGGLLVTVEFGRDTGGAIAQLPGAAVQVLTFDAISTALSPDGTRLYSAATVPLPGGVEGVAELDVTAAPGTYPLRALDARAPTTAVTAMVARPMIGLNAVTSETSIDTFGPPVLRVYAMLAVGACGRALAVPCGLAVIDPVTGTLAPDPAGELPFQLPMALPGAVLGLLPVPPPALTPTDPNVAGLLRISPGSGQRYTGGILMSATTDGVLFMTDVSHFALSSDNAPMARTGYTSASTAPPRQQDNTPYPSGTLRIALWDERPAVERVSKVGDPVLTVDTTVLNLLPHFTPGYTQAETWSLTWQGTLPALTSRPALATLGGSTTAPITEVAFQSPTGLTGPGTVAWRDVIHVYDPLLSARVGDFLIATSLAKHPDGTLVCKVPFDLVITAINRPTADRPGGSLSVVAAPVQPVYTLVAADGVVQANNDGTYKTAQADPACILGTADPRLIATVRTSGLVLVGSLTGYAGRPEPVTEPTASAGYELRAGAADPASCPILTEKPGDWPPSAAAMDACDADPAACRAACDTVLLQRKARRFYYPTDVYPICGTISKPLGTDLTKVTDGADHRCVRIAQQWWSWPLPASVTDPLQKDLFMPVGPVISFKAGFRQLTSEVSVPPAVPPTVPPRGSTLTLVSSSGVVPASRHPFSGTSIISAVLPGGMVVHDRSVAANNRQSGQRVFAAFQDNVVIDFATDELGINAVQLR